jgi:hypothetical protein
MKERRPNPKEIAELWLSEVTVIYALLRPSCQACCTKYDNGLYPYSGLYVLVRRWSDSVCLRTDWLPTRPSPPEWRCVALMPW